MKYRPHRGALVDAMSEMIEIDGINELKECIEKKWGMEIAKITIKPYGYDKRIDWDTYVVLVVFQNTTDMGQIVAGFTDGEIKDTPIKMWKIKIFTNIALLLLYVTGSYYIEGFWRIGYVAVLIFYAWFYDDIWKYLEKK